MLLDGFEIYLCLLLKRIFVFKFRFQKVTTSHFFWHTKDFGALTLRMTRLFDSAGNYYNISNYLKSLPVSFLISSTLNERNLFFMQ